jgi:hypothetical protein
MRNASRFIRVHIGDDNLCAAIGQGMDRSFSNSTRSPGNEGSAPGQ